MSDVISVIEAAYASPEDEAVWLQQVVDRFADVVGGACGWIYDARAPDRLEWSALAASRLAPGTTHEMADILRQNRREHMDRTLRADLTVGRVSERFSDLDDDDWSRTLGKLGFADVFSVNGLDVDMTGCCISRPLEVRERTTKAELRLWSRVAAHLVLGRRLRHRLARQPASDGEAVLAPDGACLHAEGPARSARARQELRTAARDIDRARRRAGRTSDDAVVLWRGLVDGRWSLVDRFDADGRRYLVAHRNQAPVPPILQLSLREREVVTLAALGRSNKLIAYELGMSLSSAASHLASGLGKLGLARRSDLALFFAEAAKRSTDAAR